LRETKNGEGSVADSNFDQAKADGFAQKLLEMLNAGGLALMTSLGHRTGLFDAMKDLPPSTSQ
jgi:hypothetical protein